MCTTYNTFKKDGCSYEHSNPGESCIYLHACSTCRQKGLGLKRHKAHQCPEGRSPVSQNSVPTVSAAIPSVSTVVTSAQQPANSDQTLTPSPELQTSLENNTVSPIKDYCLELSADLGSNVDFTPAKPDIPKGTYLKPCYFVLNDGSVFTDKILPFPEPSYFLRKNVEFDSDYYVSLHQKVSNFNTYNYLGSRIPLKHSKLRVNKFRQLMPPAFEDISILQYMEYGFPLGLMDDFVLKPVLKNHSSSYDFYSYVDKFVKSEIEFGGITGPFQSSPFEPLMISPLMTSVKKPNSRRTVFDASFSSYSLNFNTPEKLYMGEEYEFSFPKLDDFARIILSLGKNCYLWKRDLSRFFLQLPLDPLEYSKVAFIWRGKLLFFTSYIWGCRHAGMNGQRVTNLVSAIHRSLGLSALCLHKEHGCNSNCLHLSDSPDITLAEFNTLNYQDDFAGCEESLDKCKLAFDTMGTLFEVLGLSESIEKSVSPTQVMTFLGVQFDTRTLEMRIDEVKCQELKFELSKWKQKTVASKTELQSILGKLLWVSRAVKYSRCFVLRIIAETKKLKSQNQKTKLSNSIRKDFLWWDTYLNVFNGVHLMVPDFISEQIVGDDCPSGLGCWYPNKQQYFSSEFPLFLKDPQIPIHLKELFA